MRNFMCSANGDFGMNVRFVVKSDNASALSDGSE